MDKIKAVREFNKLRTQEEFLENALEEIEFQDESRSGIEGIIKDLQKRQHDIALQFIREEGPVEEENHKRHDYKGAHGSIRRIKRMSNDEGVALLMRLGRSTHGMAYFRGYRAAVRDMEQE